MTGEPAERRAPKCSMVDRHSHHRCLHPAAHRVVLGCVHEHMLCGFVCTLHVEAVRNRGSITCGGCASGPAPHECPMLGREVTRDEARRFLS